MNISSTYLEGSGSFDHSIVSAMWTLGGNQELLDTYHQALEDHGIEDEFRFTIQSFDSSIFYMRRNKMYTLSLEIINKCNLNCTYCYLGEKKNTYMSVESAKKAVDIAVHEAQKQYDKTLIVYFIGGEPLMAFETMKSIVDYANGIGEKNGLKVKFSTTINGTLITRENVELFIKNDFEIKVSIDGPQFVHDLNRHDYVGNGSYNRIMERLPYLREYEEKTGKTVAYAHVVTKNNYQFFEQSFRFLLDLKADKIESGIDYYCQWEPSEILELKEQIRRTFNLFKEEVKKRGKASIGICLSNTCKHF